MLREGQKGFKGHRMGIGMGPGMASGDGLEWNGIGWERSGMKWNRMERSGMEWNGMGTGRTKAMSDLAPLTNRPGRVSQLCSAQYGT